MESKLMEQNLKVWFMKVAYVFVSVFVPILVLSQEVRLPHNQLKIIGNIHQIEYRSSDTLVKRGTAFNIFYSEGSTKSNYIISARHIFVNVKKNSFVKYRLFVINEWRTFEGFIRFHKNDSVDVAVIEPIYQDENDLKPNAIPLTKISPVWGDVGFFYGYPATLELVSKSSMIPGFKTPLIKRATFSGRVIFKESEVFVLDGLNNPGFSGGPVFFKNRKNSKDQTWYLVGLVSGYLPQFYEQDEKGKIIGKSGNSGLILVYPIGYILEIIRESN